MLKPITSRRPLPAGHGHAFYLEAFGLLKVRSKAKRRYSVRAGLTSAVFICLSVQLDRYDAGVKSAEAALAYDDDTPESRALLSLALALKAQQQLSDGDLR